MNPSRRDAKEPEAPCATCGSLPASSYALQKYGWPEDDTRLPDAAGKLVLVKDLAPHGARTRHLKRCPACGAWFLYRTDYEFLVNGSEDEEFLDRLTDAEAAAHLAGAKDC